MKKALYVLILVGIILSCCKTSNAAPIQTLCKDHIDLGRDENLMQFLICDNISVEKPNSTITRIVIVINGNNRNAQDYYNFIKKAADTSHIQDALIIAPQFLIKEDIDYHKLPSTFPYWDELSWEKGDYSISNKPFSVSSYELLDALIGYVTDSTRFPHVQSVTLVGHSEGADFVNLYAASSTIHEILSQKGIGSRFVVANPGSYLYFNTDRNVENSQTKFAPLPTDVVQKCPDFNTYEYGLGERNAYLSKITPNEIARRYTDKSIIYLLGTHDNDPFDTSLDVSCGANIEGSERLERGTIFYNYLGFHFGKSVYSNHKKVLVDGVGHDSYGMFNSDTGRFVLFPPLKNITSTENITQFSWKEKLLKFWSWLTS